MKIYLYTNPDNLSILNKMINEPAFLEECKVLKLRYKQPLMPGEMSCMVSISYDEFIRLLDSGKIKVY